MNHGADRTSKADREVRLSLLGTSHILASPSELEELAASKAAVLAKLTRLHEQGAILGALLIPTCNRFEILIDQHPEKPIDLRQILSESKVELLALEDRDAVKHLLRVAVGLESMVAGEDQIQGQVRRAFRDSENLNLLSRNLHMLRNRILAAARDVRRRAGLCTNKVSLPALGAELMLERASRLAVVGAGETARIAIESIRRKHKGELWIINRSLDRAERLASHFDAKALSLEAYLEESPAVDGVLFAVYSDRQLLAPGHIPGLKVAVDLSMPSVLDPRLKAESDLTIWDLDTIRARATSEASSRNRALEICKDLAEAQSSVIWRKLLSNESRFNGVVDLHMESAVAEFEHAVRSQLRHLSHQDQEHVRKLLIKAAKRNAHYHLKDLRNLAAT